MVYLKYFELSPLPTNVVGGWLKIDGRWNFEVGLYTENILIKRRIYLKDGILQIK